jgi:hypothetical protein
MNPFCLTRQRQRCTRHAGLEIRRERRQLTLEHQIGVQPAAWRRHGAEQASIRQPLPQLIFHCLSGRDRPFLVEIEMHAAIGLQPLQAASLQPGRCADATHQQDLAAPPRRQRRGTSDIKRPVASLHGRLLRQYRAPRKRSRPGQQQSSPHRADAGVRGGGGLRI